MLDRAVLHQLGDDLLGLVGGNGETDADAAAVRRIDGGVDADHLAVDIDQRPAGIAVVDRRIDLDEIVIGTAVQIAAASRDDAGGNGGADAEGIADREDLVAELQLVGIAPGDGCERLRRFDLQDGKVRLGVGAQQLGRKLGAVIQRYLDVDRVLNDMVVGDDDAVRADDEAGAERHGALALLLARHLLGEGDALIFEELAELLVHRRVAVGAGVGRLHGRGDGDDGRLIGIDDRCEGAAGRDDAGRFGSRSYGRRCAESEGQRACADDNGGADNGCGTMFAEERWHDRSPLRDR